MINYPVVTLITAFLIEWTKASAGDRSRFFQNCLSRCETENCEQENLQFSTTPQPFHLWLLHWTCEEECDYKCMWETVDAFQKRHVSVPQFYGKWPFLRFYGIQEPASVAFSIYNFYMLYKNIRWFRKEVPADSPMYWFWHFLTLVSMNGWIWSTIFHARDSEQTEFMDYSCAFSIILIHCYCMVMRFMKDIPRFILVTITVFFIAFYANHIAYLRMGRFDYSYNMLVNLLVGSFTAIGWCCWSVYNRYRRPYAWKLGLFVAITSATTMLELIDRPPFFYIFDFHSLWHLATALFSTLFFSFLIDDCKFLRKEKFADYEKVLKDD